MMSPARLLSSWAAAQQLVGVHNATAPSTELLETFYSYAPPTARCGPLAYVPVRKAASEAIWVNMRHWARTLNISCSVYEPEAEPDDAKRCAFTFVRDPLARFASGFAELEYLFRKGQYLQRFSRGGQTDWRADFVGWEFTRHRVGTPERAAAFVRDLLALRWLRPRPPPAIATGLDHVFSNVGAIKRRQRFASSCVIVGRVERFEADWPTMLDVCSRRGMQLAPFPFNQSLGSHVSSQSSGPHWCTPSETCWHSSTVQQRTCRRCA